MDSTAFFLRAGCSATMHRRRWRTAFVAIHCCRVIRGLTRKELISRRHKRSYVSLNVLAYPDKNENHTPFSRADATSLAKLVKEKNLDDLLRLGGASQLITALASDAETGILGDEEDRRQRQEAYGANTYAKTRPKRLFWFVLDALKDTFLIILLVCAVFSLAFGIKINGAEEGWYDGASIFLAIFLVVVVSAVSNFSQARRFNKLSSESYIIKAEVVRSGRRQNIPITDVVVGDIVCLKSGDQVPADGLILDGHSLQVDESSMTGESNHVNVEANTNPFLTSGVMVVDGQARMLVTSVGVNTTWGEMMSSITCDSNEPTPLQERLQKLTTSIGNVGIVVAAIVFTVLALRYFTGSTRDEYGQREFDRRKATFNSVMNALVRITSDAITIIVVAVPEGLPLAVTLTLAYSMKRMMKDQAMVRKLSACETMGSTTTICTDKTGTLTMNKMKVAKFCIGEEEVIRGASIERNLLKLLHQGVASNTEASVYKANPASEPEFSGSPTEKAILSWAVMDLAMEVEDLKRNHTILHVEAFNSEKKCSGVLLRKHDEERTTTIHWKGAAEMILARCVNYYEIDGTRTALDEVQRKNLQEIIKGMSGCSLRCIAFAYRQAKEEDIVINDEGRVHKLKEDELTLLGLVGLKDPCRPEVREAIKTCRLAGVSIKMITGDSLLTAKAIALECGILGPSDDDLEGVVIEGQQFRNHTSEERMEMVDRILVMARSTPFDKLLMVQCLKQKGHVVAVTGDGTNDAPALKEADVGLSMGIQGTTVAKESSDIVILDDNFNSIVMVLKWGRCVYNNIQKFIQFQLTVNVAALAINFVAAISSGKVPLTTVQLLWVNLIMDTLGALALATERPTNELLKKAPVGRIEPLITKIMWRNLLAQALYQIVVLLIFQFKGQSIFGVRERVKNTMIFNTFVLFQVFNEFNARKLEEKNVFKGIFQNPLFLGIVVFTLILQVVMVEILRRFANTDRLSWRQWSICAGLAIISWPIGWIVKCIEVPAKHHFQSLSP